MAKINKLWDKGFASHQLVERFTSSDDIVLDQKLVGYDAYGSLAHAKMLAKQQLISGKEFEQIAEVLLTILSAYQNKQYFLKYGDEDVHTRLESDISEKYPTAGGKIHIGRSRNDQVLIDLRLFTKDQLHTIALLTIQAAQAFLSFAQKYEFVAMPGYTHMQQAMLSSVGLWASQFGASLIDDVHILKTAYQLNNQSPLGSGAGYGISLPLDREYTAQLLGFAQVQQNALYCQNSRGKIESLTLHAFEQIMLTLGKFAQDLLLFTTSEFNFFTVDQTLTTGSSIMPQKRNLDVMELLRAKVKTIQSHGFLISSIVAGLPSGYNRDTQEMKKVYLESFEIVQSCLEIVLLTLQSLVPKKEKLKEAISQELYAAHYAYELMQKNSWPFREAYQFVGAHLEDIPKYDPVRVLKQTSTLGGPGQLRLNNSLRTLQRKQIFWEKEKQRFEKALQELTKK